MAIRKERTARAIITLGSYVLLARGKHDVFYHLPGGHCENGESAGDTLRRELREELGRDVSELRLVTTLRNTYTKGAITVDEQMTVYKATLFPVISESPPRSMEEHLTFAWMPVAGLWQVNLLPPVLKDWIGYAAGGVGSWA